MTLNSIQPTDTEVSLTGTGLDVLAIPALVTIPANTGSATFEVTGVAGGSAQVKSGPLNGTTRQTTVQVVLANPTLVSVLPSPAGLALGAVTTLTVTLNGTQPTDTTIPGTSSVADIVNLPATVTIPAGSLTASMPVTGLATGTTTVTLGPLNGTQAQTTLTVNQLSQTSSP